MAMIALGELLVEKNFITKQQLEEALQTQRVFSGRKLGEYLVDRGYLSQAELERALEMQNALRSQTQEVASGEKAGLLAEVPLLKELTGAELEELTGLCRVENFERGHYIFVEGEAGNAVYFLTAGSVRLLKSKPTGGDEELAVVGAGEVFGEVDFLAQSTRSQTATAQLTSAAMVLTREKYDELQAQDALLGLKLTKVFARSLALRLQAAEARLLEESGKPKISQGFY